jgi:hypothetical protein
MQLNLMLLYINRRTGIFELGGANLGFFTVIPAEITYFRFVTVYLRKKNYTEHLA